MLSLNVIWTDRDLVECRVRATGEGYSATADIYFTVGSLREFADTIAAFPKSTEDHREFATENYKPDGNAFRLSLQCIDGSGHGVALVELADHEDTRQTALIRFPVEAAEVDEFEKALRKMSATEKGSAMLGSDATVSV